MLPFDPTNADYFAARRTALLAHMADNACLILATAPVAMRNNDVAHPYRQASNFYYLTGISAPDCVLILSNARDMPSYTVLYRTQSALDIRWQGEGLSAATLAQYDVDAAVPMDKLAETLDAHLASAETLYYDWAHSHAHGDAHHGLHSEITASMHRLKRRARLGITPPDVVRTAEPIIGQLRLYKDDWEMACLARAAQISVAAHTAAIRTAQTAKTEGDVARAVEATFLMHGADAPAFRTIAAFAGNACTLHYEANNAPLNKGMMLLDAGAEFAGYAGDITSCFPVKAPLVGEARAVYEAVLEVKDRVIAKAAAGLGDAVSFEDLHLAACRWLSEALVDLGVLAGSVERVLESKQYEAYFMHRIGHWIGLDVHDAGAYRDKGGFQRLADGMAFTIEPGLYFSPQAGLDERWWHIGMRLEDTLMIRAGKVENLTQDVPRAVDALNAMI